MSNKVTKQQFDETQMKTDLRYTCKTPKGNSPSPHKVESLGFGDFSSYCTNEFRIWGFVEKSEQEAFCTMFTQAIKE